MKRIRDDVPTTGSEFKRPSRAESYVLGRGGGEVAAGLGFGGVGVGTGAGGGSGGVGGSSLGCAVGNITQKLTTDDALAYLKEVKEMFQDQKEKYDMFLEVMKDFKSQRTDTTGVIARVKELFKGHSNLIYGFNTFLPRGYEIYLTDDGAPPKKTVEFEEAISFVNKIKKRFVHDDQVYKSFLEILNKYRKETKDIKEVYNEVSELFRDQADLLKEFVRFLPDTSATPLSHRAPSGQNSIQRHNERSSCTPMFRQMHNEKQRRRDRIATTYGERDLSVDRPELDDDSSVKFQRDQRKRVEKELRDRRNHNQEYRESDPNNNIESSSHPFLDKRKCVKKIEGAGANSNTAYDEKGVFNQAFVFCEKVKERLGSAHEYQSFLKCLNIFTKDIIIKQDLQNLVTDILGKHRDLMDEFNRFLEHENIDEFLAGVMSKRSFCSEGNASRSVQVDDREREQKRGVEGFKERDRSKEKYNSKSIQELDLSNCQSCTPSYRLLPADYPISSPSQRSELGAQVLNDHWVSATSGSEDFSFKHMRKNQYEENLFKCEDDRFELDMLLESACSTAKRAEEFLKIIAEDGFIPNNPIRIEDHFTALNLRCIERIYGDHGLDVLDMLRRNPTLTVPVILLRLKQKEYEWKRCQEDFNKVWAEVYNKNHYKSLDHRSFYFKQQDSKNLSAKSLVTEIKELKEKTQKEDDTLLYIAGGHRQPLVSHLKYEYSDTSIHEDLYNIIRFSCQEMCSAKEQINKVMWLWTSFLEPTLGVPPRLNAAEHVIDAEKVHYGDIKCNASKILESPQSPRTDTKLHSGISEFSAKVYEKAGFPAGKLVGTDTAIGDSSAEDSLRSIDGCYNDSPNCPIQSENVNRSMQELDKSSAEDTKMIPAEGEVNLNGSLESGAVKCHGRSSIEVISGSSGAFQSSELINKDSELGASCDAAPPSQDEEVPKSDFLASGIRQDGVVVDRHLNGSDGPSKLEKEEGELSPNDECEDGAYVSVDATMMDITKARPDGSRHHQSGEDLQFEEAGGDNVAETDDSENVSEEVGGESGSDSHVCLCLPEDEDEEHDEIDGKAESEPEACVSSDVHLVGDDGVLLPHQERLFHSVKPLAKHVPTVILDEKLRGSTVFYGNDDFYVLFRLHQVLYERILSAKTKASLKLTDSKDTSIPDGYTRFMSALFSLLDGSSENTKFEDECRAIIGNQSYVLFTLDKLIYKVIKQMQAMISDDMDNKLLELYEYEKLRRAGKLIDSVYFENTRVLLHDENIYRLEYSSSPSQLSIQLMDTVNEKPEAFPVSMDMHFSSYLHTDYLSHSPSKRDPQDLKLRRNMRQYESLDESLAISNAMEGVEAVNGLECKLSCRTSKISYVLDTEDFFFRRRKNLAKGKSRRHHCDKDKVDRFHKFLLAK